MALPIVLKGEFKFALILYITIFVFLSPAAALIRDLYFKTHTYNKRTELVYVSVAVEGRKNYSPERFEGSVHLGLPF